MSRKQFNVSRIRSSLDPKFNSNGISRAPDAIGDEFWCKMVFLYHWNVLLSALWRSKLARKVLIHAKKADPISVAAGT